MPHVSIKLIGNPTKEEKERLSEKIAKIIEDELGKPRKYISVAIEGVGFSEWENIYNTEIKDNKNITLKPKYTNPKTFE